MIPPSSSPTTSPTRLPSMSQQYMYMQSKCQSLLCMSMFFKPATTSQNIRLQLFRTNSVCGAGDFGGFTTSTPIDCARRCLQSYPDTKYIEFQPAFSDCDCDQSTLGNCSPSSSSGWTVYLILTSGKFHENACTCTDNG